MPAGRDRDDREGSIAEAAAQEPRRPRIGLGRRLRSRIAAARVVMTAAARAVSSGIAALGSWLARLLVRAFRFALLHGALAGISLLGGAVLIVVAAEYGYQPNRDTLAWSALVPRYVDAASCTSCHAPEVAKNAAAAHAAVTCQACHGPLAGHDGTEVATDPEAIAGGEEVVIGPAREAGEPICLTCHEATVGRPAGFPVVSSVTHFPLPSCTVCHDPHEPPAVAPPDIRHPLDGLPACTVCHRADGIRPVPVEHPEWDGDCRACHRSAQPLGT